MHSILGSSLAIRLVSALGLLLLPYLMFLALQMPPSLRSWSSDPGTTHSSPVPSSGSPYIHGPWNSPTPALLNNLTAALTTPSGVYGFRFDGSHVPDSDYGVYNWCNMPHVRRTEYVVPPPVYTLRYVEVVHRHHKRTPYTANGFPVEPYEWNCDDTRLRVYAEMMGEAAEHRSPGNSYLKTHFPSDNPFVTAAFGWRGSCRFPQLTRGGLVDAWQHGADLYGVYHDLLGFLPAATDRASWAAQTAFRVTNNEITSETATMVLGGMQTSEDLDGAKSLAIAPLALVVEPLGLDSLEPQYACLAGRRAFAAITSTEDEDGAWAAHLAAAAEVFRQLDAASGVDPGDPRGFHASVDHYYDNLSARRCHEKADVVGVSRALADTVFRLGQWEYSRMYRDDSRSLGASVALWGVWVAQLARHLRAVVSEQSPEPRYRHNVAHDGSLSRLLSILQADEMVWPGMGSEVVVEVWEMQQEKTGDDVAAETTNKFTPGHNYHVRILFGGRVLRSSNPDLGLLDMRPLPILLDYLDNLVGHDASMIPGMCNGTTPLW